MQIGIGNNSKKYDIFVRWCCALSILSMIGIGIVVYGASLRGFAICMLFYFAYMLLPGLAILRLFRTERLCTSSALASASFLGWALCVFLVYVSAFINTDILLFITGPFLSAFFIWNTIASGRKEMLMKEARAVITNVPLSFCIFLLIVTLFCLVGTQYQYLAPPKGNFAFISGDRAYHMGMANAISHGLPLESIWIKGIRVKYHIFTDILFSVPIRLFDVRTDTVGQLFAPVLTAWLFSTSLYAFFREMTDRPKRAGIYCLIFLLSSMYITRRWTSSLAFKFLLTNDNCAGFGIAAFLIFIILFKKWYERYMDNDSSHWKVLLLCLVLMMLITGIKGPIAAVLAAGLWGMLIIGLLLRKMKPKMLIPMAILTIGFVVIYVSVLGASGQINAAGGATLSFAEITNIAFWKKSLIAALKSYGIPKIIRVTVTMIVFAAFFLTVYTLPFCIGYVRELYLVFTGRKDYYPERVLVYATSLVGFLAMMMLSFTGHNQVYFGLVAVITAPIISYWLLEDLERASDASRFAAVLRKTIVAAMAITIIFTSASLAGYIIRKGGESIGYASQSIALSKYGGVSADEYSAMMWIRENTEKDALLANDRYYSVPLKEYSPENRWNSSFFLYEVYANRFSYISGSAYDLDQSGSSVRIDRIENNLKLYDPQNNERGALARELGIDYVIVSKRFSGELDLANEDYERCYSNPEVDIYKITG